MVLCLPLRSLLPEAGEPIQEGNILQHHIELLQAFSLRQSRQRVSAAPTLGSGIERYAALMNRVGELETILRDAATAFHLKRLNAASAAASEEEKARFGVVESLRVQTEATRNWAFPHQIVRIAQGIFAQIDERASSTIGFPLSPLPLGFDQLIRTVEQRTRAHTLCVQPIFRSKSVHQLAHSCHKQFPDLFPCASELNDFLVKHAASLEESKWLIVWIVDHERLPSLFTFHHEQLLAFFAGAYDLGAIRALIDRMSLDFGALQDGEEEHFFLNNPIWTKPFIRLTDNTVFLPVPNLLYGFVLEIAFDLLAINPQLRDAYHRARSDFLEGELERLLQTALPSARVSRGIKWTSTDDGKTYENDFLVEAGSWLLILEAKSNIVTDPARRGAIKRVEEEVRETMVGPSRQSMRLSQMLSDNRRLHVFQNGVELGTTNVTRIIRINVLLDSVIPCSVTWREVRQAALVPPDVPTTVTMGIAELESVFQILNGETEKLHYLQRRVEIEKSPLDYAGDEMDILGFYLDTGLVMGGAEFTQNQPDRSVI